MRIRAYLLLLFCLCWSALVSAAPLATGFTYQGSLKANGSAAADGDYDFQFTLYAADTGGSPLAGPVNVMAQTVSEGVFTAALDFGAAFDGSPRFLEIQVRKVGGPGLRRAQSAPGGDAHPVCVARRVRHRQHHRRQQHRRCERGHGRAG
jgi:hypothetical protein